MPAITRRIVQSESMRMQIHADLRQRLQGMAFTEQDRLIDTEIARTYGTSRMPAREALMLLANQGYLRQTSRGFVIPTLSPEDVRDIFEVRKLLEPHAAASAAAALTRAGLARLAAARADARAACDAGDARALMLANMAFRAAWIGALSNRRLREAIEGFSDHAQAVRIATLREPAIQSVVMAGVERLHAGFEAHDAMRVRAAMADFMAEAESAYFRAARTPE